MKLICINCPRGCHLEVENINGEIGVSGNFCPRGKTYAESEMLNPLRTLTTTLPIVSKKYRRLPVMTSEPIPKGKVMDAMKALKDVSVEAPVKMGDVIVKGIIGLDADIIASKTIEE
jgi:CxxC motif-containing protein